MADPRPVCVPNAPRSRGRALLICGVAALLLAWSPVDNAGARPRGSSRRPNVAERVARPGCHGRVFEDRNANGIQDEGEPGVAGVWVLLRSGATGIVRDSTSTDAAGDYALLPSATSSGDTAFSLECVPADGYFPVGSCVRDSLAGAGEAATPAVDFRLAAFRHMTLSVRNVLSLGAGDLREKDWAGNALATARGDLDLVAGAEVNGTDPLSVWFNHYPGNPLFDASREYARTVANAVLSLAVDTLALRTGPLRARADVVTGTRRSAAGNFFTWITQGTAGNEGFLPSSYTQACQTGDQGDVRSLVTGDVAAGPGVDILAGTRSPQEGRGTIELWTSDDAPTPTFAFAGRYPGAEDSGTLGEVTALALARLGGAGLEAIAGTDLGDAGQLVVFGRESSGPFLRVRWQQMLKGEAVRCLAIADITGDGRPDLIVGARTGPASGVLELWRNDDSVGGFTFTRVRDVPLDGIPSSIIAADFGGLPGPDIVVGLRDTDSSFGGRAEIFFCDGHTLPSRGSDPSAGQLSGWVPALVSGAFDAGTRPPATAPAPGFAAGVHPGSRGGELFVFLR